MRNPLRILIGHMDAVEVSLRGGSEEHLRFLRSGHQCPACGKTLRDYKVFRADGKEIGSFLSRDRGAAYCECPFCQHRWKFLDSSSIPQNKTEVLEIVETKRSEEVFGEDRRVIDNLKNTSEIARRISFSKEWSKSCQLDFERARRGESAFTVGAKDAAALKVTSEDKVRQTYLVAHNMKETSIEEISCRVAARSTLIVVVRWKRIWQHGFVRVGTGKVRLEIPFRVSVGVTFDQEQIAQAGPKSRKR